MSDVTVVCCYNDEKMYADFVETLKSQACPCEIIGIDIVGVAGVRFDEAGVITNIRHKWRYRNGEISYAGSRRVEGGMMTCGTVDECFFGRHTEHFREYPFNEDLCNDWHLYAAEACLHVGRLRTGGAKLRIYL
ncbi:MAG: hypothetical protein IJG37_07970 [Synergistaceae bacterium]|nr:hypothetical protein [Synergistaceae bacterium]MBQ6972470.1 hypothetical protein [Synergistaceae bacterium]